MVLSIVLYLMWYLLTGVFWLLPWRCIFCLSCFIVQTAALQCGEHVNVSNIIIFFHLRQKWGNSNQCRPSVWFATLLSINFRIQPVKLLPPPSPSLPTPVKKICQTGSTGCMWLANALNDVMFLSVDSCFGECYVKQEYRLMNYWNAGCQCELIVHLHILDVHAFFNEILVCSHFLGSHFLVWPRGSSQKSGLLLALKSLPAFDLRPKAPNKLRHLPPDRPFRVKSKHLNLSYHDSSRHNYRKVEKASNIFFSG